MADDWAADATEDTVATDFNAVANGDSHEPQPLRENKINKKRLEGQVQQAVLFLRYILISAQIRTERENIVNHCAHCKKRFGPVRIDQKCSAGCSDYLLRLPLPKAAEKSQVFTHHRGG